MTRRAPALAAITAAALVAAAPALRAADPAADAFVADLVARGPDACRADLAAREARYLASAPALPPALGTLLYAQSLVCVALAAPTAPDPAIPVTDIGGDVLLGAPPPDPGSIDPLHTGALTPLATPPDRSATTPARGDRTPDRLLAKAGALLSGVIPTLASAPPDEAATIRLAIDAEARHAIFDRFREVLPPGK
jgi:hypothetical protein